MTYATCPSPRVVWDGGAENDHQPAEAAVIVVICFGMFIVLSVQAVLAGFPSTPFTDAGLIWL